MRTGGGEGGDHPRLARSVLDRARRDRTTAKPGTGLRRWGERTPEGGTSSGDWGQVLVARVASFVTRAEIAPRRLRGHLVLPFDSPHSDTVSTRPARLFQLHPLRPIARAVMLPADTSVTHRRLDSVLLYSCAPCRSSVFPPATSAPPSRSVAPPLCSSAAARLTPLLRLSFVSGL